MTSNTDKYMYKGERITLNGVSKKLDISKTSAHNLIKNSVESGQIQQLNEYLVLDTLISEYVEERAKHIELFNSKIERLFNLVGIEPPIYNGKNKLEVLKITREKLELAGSIIPSISSTEEWLDLYYYMIKGNFRLLVTKGPSKETVYYNGVYYYTSIAFYRSLRIIKDTLFKNVLAYEGDINKAILNVRDDPDFGVRVNPVINGVSYTSVAEASRALNFDAVRYKELYREYKDFDIAYQKYLDTASKYSEVGLFPLVENGVVYNSLLELSESIGLSDSHVRALYNDGMSFGEIIAKRLSDLDYKELCGGRIKYRTKQDLHDITGINLNSIHKHWEGGLEGEYTIFDFIERSSVEYKGEFIVHQNQFVEKFDLPPTFVRLVRLNLMLLNSNEEKVEKLLAYQKRINYVKKFIDIPLTSIEDVSAHLGVSNRIVYKIFHNYNVDEPTIGRVINVIKLGIASPFNFSIKYYSLVPYMKEMKVSTFRELGAFYGITGSAVNDRLKRYPTPLTEEDAKDFISKLENNKPQNKTISSNIWD